MSGGVWLMRHGALPPNPEGRFTGQRDVPLAEAGHRQARSWHDRLRHIPFAAIVSSDLARCAATARLVRGQRPIPLLLEPALREIGLGLWEGLSRAELELKLPGAHAARGRDMAHYRPAGGESFADLAARVLPAFERWAGRYAGQALLVVAHAGVNRVILARCMALPLRHALDLPQPPACCTRLAGTQAEPAGFPSLSADGSAAPTGA